MSATLPQSRSDARSFHLRVFGCQMNFYDGELMRASLLGRGYQESADPDQADVVLPGDTPLQLRGFRRHLERAGRGRAPHLRRYRQRKQLL